MKNISEQERLNHLIARFLRLDEAGKVYMNNITRQLTHICGSEPREEAYRKSEAASGIGGLKERNTASL
jgi:hypothetical protein